MSAELELLERSYHLSMLHEALGTVRAERRGVLVLLGGEAGGGKTALLSRFTGIGDPADRVLWGSCDPLFTPRPLGPFLDIAQDVGGELADLTAAGAKPYHIAAALVRVAQSARSAIVILEDLHWADEATLDVLSLLGRRIADIPALVIATYRDDELDRAHPLRRLLGELRGTSSIRRLTADPLSPDAVAVLATRRDLDAAALYRITAGNPFFVSEVVACPGPDIPSTVRDAVLARAARLSDAATAVVEAVSIALPHAELWLLDALVTDPAAGLAESLDSGILEARQGGIGFRHELARMAIEESLRPHRRNALHRRALEVLSDLSTGVRDLARLAYHAEAAEDGEAVLRFAPAAARHAASIGAHRESAAQYERALRFGDALPADARADLLEGRSYECYLTDQTGPSIEALEHAITHWRTAGNRAREGAALSQLSRRLWCGGHTGEAAKAAHDAVLLLNGCAPGHELADAYSGLSSLYLNYEQLNETIVWGRRALDLADACGDTAVTVHSLNNIGTMELLAGRPDGRRKLERSLALAERAGLEEHVGRAYIHLGWAMTRTRAYEMEALLDRGVKTCRDLGLETWALYVIAYRARMRLDRGHWNAAAADAGTVLGSVPSVPLLRLLPLTVLGLIRARRGDPQQWTPLDESLVALAQHDELQYSAPVATARAEAAWLDGRGGDVDGMTRDVLDMAVARGAGWVAGELLWLRRLAGIQETATVAAGPYAAQLAGDLVGAAEQWRRLGCPYDAALALVESDDEPTLRSALAELQRLGAHRTAAIVARRLREHGVRDVPRGPRPQTEHHPARLTRREAEVLGYVQQGASNAEIAARLYLSEKTVHHHVSAILRKLGVVSRGQAVYAAAQRGLIPQ